MTCRKLAPVGRIGQRIRKASVAGGLFICTCAASLLVRDPAWDGYWDAFTWPQLFLQAPVLFFSCAAVWQSVCLIAEWLYSKAKRKAENPQPEGMEDPRRTLEFWLRDSLRVCALYLMTGVIGDIPMAVYYLAAVRGWHLHWSWWGAADSGLPLMIAAWWILERIDRRTRRTRGPNGLVT
jgi:hypothetical protein